MVWKKCNISIWLPIVKSLLFNNIIKSIPISPISNNSFQNYDENINKTKRLVCGLKKYDTKILTKKRCSGGSTNTHHFNHSNCKVSNEKSFIKKQTIRHNQRVIGRPNKHLEINNYVSKIDNDRWKMGIPITMDIWKIQLFCHVKIHDQEPNYKLFSQVYVKDSKNKLSIFKRFPWI